MNEKESNNDAIDFIFNFLDSFSKKDCIELKLAKNKLSFNIVEGNESFNATLNWKHTKNLIKKIKQNLIKK